MRRSAGKRVGEIQYGLCADLTVTLDPVSFRSVSSSPDTNFQSIFFFFLSFSLSFKKDFRINKKTRETVYGEKKNGRHGNYVRVREREREQPVGRKSPIAIGYGFYFYRLSKSHRREQRLCVGRRSSESCVCVGLRE